MNLQKYANLKYIYLAEQQIALTALHYFSPTELD